MRSNCVHMRTNPAFCFYFESVCKFMQLCFVTALGWQQAPFQQNGLGLVYPSRDFKALSPFLELVVFTSVLFEFGKLLSVRFSWRQYFAVSRCQMSGIWLLLSD